MDFAIGTMIFSFFAALTVYFRSKSPFYIKLFPPYLALTVFVELFADYLVAEGKQNVSVYNIFMIISFSFYFFVLREIIGNKLVKKIILNIVFVFFVLGIINLLFIQKIGEFNSMTFCIGSLLIVGMCIFYFFELFQLPKATSLLRDPAFWICSGLLFFYVCTFPFFGLSNLISNSSMALIYKFSFILLGINVFLYSLFTIAFLCQIGTNKST
jgi:hypothetical protein